MKMNILTNLLNNEQHLILIYMAFFYFLFRFFFSVTTDFSEIHVNPLIRGPENYGELRSAKDNCLHQRPFADTEAQIQIK